MDLAQRARTLYATFGAGDPVAYRAAFAPDVVWHVPGANPVSGRYRGEAYFTTMADRMRPLDAWTLDVVDVWANEPDRAALVRLRLRGERHGMRIGTGAYHLVRFDEAGRVVEGWGFVDEQEGLDRFFALQQELA
ncbi:MAG: nuclear transport factor 2 family protein [Pseudonocardia sp.]